MGTTVGDLLMSRLRAWGVDRVFGYPGDGINGILAAFQRAGGDPVFVQARHEEMTAFMACGHAKFTGRTGVCLATSGPGAVHLLNGLYDAKMDHQPVVALVGQTATTAMGGSYQQEIDLLSLFKDVAHEYVHMVTTPEQMPGVVDRAFRIAHSERTVTCLVFPADIQDVTASEQPPHEFKMTPGTVGYSIPNVTPAPEDLQRAADVLNDGKRVAILVGQGARGAADEVIQAADLLGAGVAKALLGKDVLSDDLPFVTGSIGLLGTRPSYDMMMDCDTLLMVGTSFPYSQFLPDWGAARAVEIDIDARMIGMRYPTEVALVGDAGRTLRGLLPLLRRKEDRGWRTEIESDIEAWWKLVASRARIEADPINPQLLFWELNPRMPEGSIVTCDSGSAANWYARQLIFRRGMRGSLSGTLATMGSAVPYAIAAKFAYPDRPVIALAGDGAMQMNGMAELLTVAKYWSGWSDPRFVVLVLHNNDLNQVTWEMRAMEGIPKFSETQDIPDVSYADFAELCGLQGIRVERPGQVGSAWDRAFASGRPTVIDAVCDPSVPPLPPHIEFDQVKAMVGSVLKGDPDSRDVVKQSFKGKLQEFVTGR